MTLPTPSIRASSPAAVICSCNQWRAAISAAENDGRTTPDAVAPKVLRVLSVSSKRSGLMVGMVMLLQGCVGWPHCDCYRAGSVGCVHYLYCTVRRHANAGVWRHSMRCGVWHITSALHLWVT